MAGISSFFNNNNNNNNNLITLFLLLLLHLGCFYLFTSKLNHPKTKKHRKITPLSHHHHLPSPTSLSSSSSRFKPHKSLSSSFSYLKHIISSCSSNHPPCKSTTTTLDLDLALDHITNQTTTTPSSSLLSTRSSQNCVASLLQPETTTNQKNHARNNGKNTTNSSSSDISSDYFVFPLRNDIFPCPSCGEIFQNPAVLDNHQSIKHAVSELIDGDSGKNIVRIIFITGWNNERPGKNPNPTIHRILKIHNSPKILSRFEEYRETVKAKAARNGVVRKRDERCIADGNELLRFHCTTFMCELGHDGNSSICNGQYCSVCGIVRSGFSPKMDGISTLSSSRRAHVAIPDEIEEEFKFMNVKRAMLVCRVVAGLVGCGQDEVDKEDGGFDSVVGGGGGGVHTRVDEDELLVFNPRAVLPCFVIVYTV